MTRRKPFKPLRLLAALLFIIAGTMMLLPLLWMLVVSLKPYETTPYTLEGLFGTRFTIENFTRIIQTSKMGKWIFNSFFIAAVQTVFGLLFASLASFALSVIDFKGKKLVYFVILAGMMIPIEAMIMPTYTMMISLHWVNTYKGLILPGIAMPLAVIVFKQCYDGVPRELIEAGNIDGANIFWVWRKIFLPLTRNTTGALALFVFIQSWNNYMWPMLVGSEAELMTLTVALPIFQSTFSTDMTMPMTANLFASIPAMLAFMLFQSKLEKGIAMTGIK